jgi:methylmalonyl-CoA/ethylmalonyl-CoA epimerase
VADKSYLDHLAVAAERWEDLWPRYRVALGGTWVSGNRMPGMGFGPAQVRYANNMKIEVLEPVRPEDNDFLRRFLDSRGPGPHHITFKVPDIVAKLAEVEAQGYRPVGVDLRDPGWKEAFIHPKDGPGIVVQIAEAETEWSSPPPDGFPETSAAPASFDYLAIGAVEFDRAYTLFTELLDGSPNGKGHDDTYGFDYTEIAWPSGGVIRLFPSDTSGLHHAAFTMPNSTGERTEVAPEVNLGVRLVLA